MLIIGVLTFKAALLFLLVLSTWLYWLWQRRHWYKFSLNFPTIWGWPLLGSGLRFLNFNDMLPSFGKFLSDSKRHTIALWLGLHLVVLTDEPEFVERVISSNDMLNRAVAISKPGKDIFGCGLLSSDAEDWQQQRKPLNAAFQHKVLMTFFPIFNSVSLNAVKEMGQLVGKGPRTISDLLKNTIMDGSLETTMGVKPDDVRWKQAAKNYIDSVAFILRKLPLIVVLTLVNLYELTSFCKKLQAATKVLRQFTEDIMMNQMKQVYVPNIQHEHKDTDNELIAIRKPPEIFMKQALELYRNEKLSWQNVIANVNGMITASFETTSTAVFSALILLAMHEPEQQRLYEEISQVMGKSDEDIEFRHLGQMPYLDMVMNETLRLIPPIPILGRQAEDDATLSDGLVLPRGLQVIISIYHIHRRKDIWGDDANEFNPNHFLPEYERKRHLYSFMPFSKGQRNCIGWRYAVFSIKILIARLVQKYRFVTNHRFEDIKFYSNATLTFVEEPQLEILLR